MYETESRKGPQPVTTHVINPKCVSVGELYGSFNESTDEWRDGIASYLMREATNVSDETIDHGQWIVFDGPVDPIWVENLNTVLDDNKLLCLASGERIKLRDEMKLLFEVANLISASPATVSRLGVVYVPESMVGIEEICASWCAKNLNELSGYTSVEHGRVTENFSRLVPPVCEFINTRTEQFISGGVWQRLNSMCVILGSFLKKYGNIFDHRVASQGGAQGGANDHETWMTEETQHKLQLLDQFFLYSLIWGWGGGLEGDHKENFSMFVRDLLAETGYDAEMIFPGERVWGMLGGMLGGCWGGVGGMGVRTLTKPTYLLRSARLGLAWLGSARLGSALRS